MTTSKVPEIIIIVIVAIVLVLFLMKAGYVSEGVQKYIDNIIDGIFGGQTTDSVKDISGEFQDIISQYKDCFDSNDDGCICSLQILTFSPGYVLSFITPNTMVISKEETNIPKNRESLTGKNIFCYVTYDSGNIYTTGLDQIITGPNKQGIDIILSESPIKLSYETGATEVKVGSGISNIIEPVPERVSLDFLDRNKMVYKKGNNICFILKDELSEEGKAFINSLNKCSPKPLNS